MFERFTDVARHVIVLAQEEARGLNHGYIGTEHLLLGLIKAKPPKGSDDLNRASIALESLGIKLDDVRKEVEEFIGRGEHPPSGHIPFTPRAKKVLELSLREALQLGHNFIGPEHHLLGLIREGEGVAAIVLVKLGCDLTKVRTAVIQAIIDHPVPNPWETPMQKSVKVRRPRRTQREIDESRYLDVIRQLDRQIPQLEKLARNACRSARSDRQAFGQEVRASLVELRNARRMARIGLERLRK